MYARVTRFRANPEKFLEMEVKLEDVKVQLSRISGVITSYTMWNDDGGGVTFVIYESAEAAKIAQPVVLHIWKGLMGMLVKQPEPLSFSTVYQLAG
jgi:hypothetical protein